MLQKSAQYMCLSKAANVLGVGKVKLLSTILAICDRNSKFEAKGRTALVCRAINIQLKDDLTYFFWHTYEIHNGRAASGPDTIYYPAMIKVVNAQANAV